MGKYEGKDNYGNLKTVYTNKVDSMTDKELHEETKNKIWLSAFANNNPRSDYHWQVDYCYDQWVKRNDVDGYTRAFNEVAKG